MVDVVRTCERDTMGVIRLFMLPMMILMIEDENDRAFIERLYLDNRFLMFKKAFEIVRSPFVAEDIVSDVCTLMVEKITYLRKIDVCKRRACLVIFVRNKAIDYMRRQKVEKKYMVGNEWELENAASEGEIDDDIIRTAEVECLNLALDLLDERNRNLLEMKYWRKQSDVEIAERMEIKESSVRQYLTNARRKLKRIMEEVEKNV